jgi:hypothetical protein
VRQLVGFELLFVCGLFEYLQIGSSYSPFIK